MAVLKDLNAPDPKEVSKVNKEKEEPQEKDFADELLETQKKAAKTKIVMDTIGATAKGGGKSEEDAAMKFAKEAMEMQSSTIKSLEEARKTTQEALSKAETAKNDALTALYQHQLNTIVEAEARVKAMAEKAGEGGKPSDPFAIYQEIKKHIDEAVASGRPAATNNEGAARGVSDETMVTLKKLELDQSRILLQMQTDAEVRKKEWDLKLLEFQDGSRRQWAEYRDKKDFQRQGLEGAQDLIASISAGIAADREASSTEVVKTKAKAHSKSKGAQTETSHVDFECTECGEVFPIYKGQEQATCPSCGQMFSVKE